MKKTILGSALFSLALIGSLCAEHYQIYLLGGQSNGNGRADAAQLTPPLSLEQTDVRLYYDNNQDTNSVLPEQQWINLAPGSGHGSTLYYATEFGPEVSFGRAMADAKPTENIAIIKYTYGGSSISQWSATGARYLTFVSTVQAALAALTTAGDTYVLRGMLWQQGESDTGGSADSYEANLTDLIARVRTDFNGGVAFPFVIGSLSDSQYSNITTVGSGPYKVRQAQETVAAADPTVGIAISDGFGMESDGIHFDYNGQVALGQGHATQMLALEGPDVTDPQLSGATPADGVLTAPVDSNLVATFNEPIQLKTGGNVTIRDLGPGDDIVILIPDARVSASGNQLVIDPSTDLVAGNPYAVQISATSVEDTSANPFDGIGDDTTWNFTTASTPSTTSLIHHWPMDGNAIDIGSTGGHDGTEQGDASYTTGSGGKFGEAVTLDGTGDYVQIGQSSLPASDFSLTAWIYRETAGDYMYIAGTQNSGNEGAFLRVEPATGAATANNALFANLLPPAGSQRVWGGTIPLNTWTHVAMTVSSTVGLEIFINGASAGSDATATTHDVWTNFRIGARPDSNANYFDGLIDDVAIFDGVLDSTQLANVISGGAANFDEVVADITPPSVVSFLPADGEPAAGTDSNLVVTFNESVTKGPSGDFVIKEDGGAVFETIPVTDARVSVSGTVVTINPSGTFSPFAGYHVQVADGAIEDSSGNAWSGIAGTDSTSWNFTTAPDADLLAETTGIFDENLDATNSLDVELSPGTLAPFTSAVLDAFNNDLGGVIDWETGVDANASGGSAPNNFFTSVAATYGTGGGNVLLVNFDRQMALYTNDINNQIEVLSRDGTWHNALVPDGGNAEIGLAYIMTFSGADVLEIGAAMPSRSTYALNGVTAVNFRATVTFSSSAPSVLDFSVGGTPGTGDTFLHFAAPSGETITSFGVEWISETGGTLANGQRRPVLDDLGFVVAAPSDTFATWIANPAFGLDAEDQDFLDDPDGDGFFNGLEAWFGTHPGEFSAGIVQLATDGTTTTFTHPQNESLPSELTGYYEWSPNLLDWYVGDGSDGPGGGPTVTISPNTVGATTTVTATASEALDRLFLRAGVVQD